MKSFNPYGDSYRPTDNGRGIDIASQRVDELDRASLDFIRAMTAAGRRISALDLGGGFGAHSVRMAEAGAIVIMVDVEDMACSAFTSAVSEKSLAPGTIRFIKKDFSCLTDDEIPLDIDVLYSQRAIHYVPYGMAEGILRRIFSRMTREGMVYLSAAGRDSEYGRTHPDRDKPIEARFDYVTPEMQERHAIFQKISIYAEDEMAALLRSVGFDPIRVTHSAFGNIKAVARKPK